MSAAERACQFVGGLADYLDVFDDSVIYQLVGLHFFLCLAVRKVKDVVNGLHYVLQPLAVSNIFSHKSVFCHG